MTRSSIGDPQAAIDDGIVDMCRATCVESATDVDGASWDAYVAQAAGSSVYHRWAWRHVLHSVFGYRPHYLTARRNGRLVGVLPLAETKTLLFGHALSSLPMACDAGVLADDGAARAALDERASELAHALGVEFLEYRGIVAVEPSRPQQDLYVMFRKPISGDDEANLNAIPRKQRAMVRKGISNGLIADHGDLATFFDLYSDNAHRHGTPPFPKRYFAALLAAFAEDANVLVVRTANGRPLSGVLSLFHGDEVFPIYAGDVEAARGLAANDFKYFTLMQYASRRGCRVFNYGRSKRGTGQFDFKKNWGFEPTPLVYEYLLLKRNSIPENNPSNPRYRLLIATWRNLPRWFVNWIGPHLVRGLG